MKVDYEGSFYIKVGRKYLKTDIDTTYIENLQKQNSKLETQVKQMQNFENCDYQQHIQDNPVFKLFVFGIMIFVGLIFWDLL